MASLQTVSALIRVPQLQARTRLPVSTMVAGTLALLLAITATAQPPTATDTRGQQPAPSSDRAATTRSLSIVERPLPWQQSGIARPHVADDGSVWFATTRASWLGRFSPDEDKFERITLEPPIQPDHLLVASDGRAWFAPEATDYIAAYDPQSKRLEKITMPAYEGLSVTSMALEQERRAIWFTLQDRNAIGRVDTDKREVTLTPVPAGNGELGNVTVADDGTVWITLTGTHRVASLDPDTGVISEYALPTADARPSQVLVGGDSQVWIIDDKRNYLGVLDPHSSQYVEYRIPDGDNASTATPSGAVLDGDRVWLLIGNSSGGRLLGFDTDTRQFISSSPIVAGLPDDATLAIDRQRNRLWFFTEDGALAAADVE